MTFRSDAPKCGGFGGRGGLASLGPTKVSCAHARQTDSFRASNLRQPPKPPKPPKLRLWWLAPSPISGGAVTAPAITSAHVRAGVARELRVLAEVGVTGPEAMRRSVEITAAKIRNSPVLVERQAHDGQCHACGQSLDDARPVVAVLQAKGGGHLWVHGDECHDAHRRRRATLVDRIMAAAGYGAETTREAA